MLLLGAYFVTFVASILCLMKKYRTGTTTMVKLILVTDVIIFLLVTGVSVRQIIRVVMGF